MVQRGDWGLITQLVSDGVEDGGAGFVALFVFFEAAKFSGLHVADLFGHIAGGEVEIILDGRFIGGRRGQFLAAGQKRQDNALIYRPGWCGPYR